MKYRNVITKSLNICLHALSLLCNDEDEAEDANSTFAGEDEDAATNDEEEKEEEEEEEEERNALESKSYRGFFGLHKIWLMPNLGKTVKTKAVVLGLTFGPRLVYNDKHSISREMHTMKRTKTAFHTVVIVLKDEDIKFLPWAIFHATLSI